MFSYIIIAIIGITVEATVRYSINEHQKEIDNVIAISDLELGA